MRPDLMAIAVRNRGVFRRQEAERCGYSPSELRTKTQKGGAWVVVRRGVYAERSLWDAGGDNDRYRLEVRAAMLNLEHNAYPSHTSAAALLGFPLLPEWRVIVHVTRPRTGGGRGEHGVRHHPAAVPDRDLVTHDGLVMTAPARTALDVGREHGFEAGVCACDAALRRGATRADLDRVARGMRNWPGIVDAREASQFADRGAETIGESRARVLVGELGLGSARTQVRITDGRRNAYVDLLVGRHVFEYDGRIKYVGRERGGVADRPVEQVLWEEKKREDWLRSMSLGVSRIITADFYGEARVRARARLLREATETMRRYPGSYP